MITIPRSQHETVRQLISLSPKKMQELAKALRDAPPAASFGAVARHLRTRIKLSFNFLNSVVQMVGALGTIREERNISVEELAQQIAEAARSIPLDDLTEADWSRIERDLAGIFEASKSAVTTAKAVELLNEYEHTYCPKTRIVSDIRCIFAPGEVEEPVGAIVVHTLKLAYHQDGETRHFFVALDSDDLRDLRGTLERAITKEPYLRAATRASIVGSDLE
jgi:hypothetical protein